MISLTDIIAPMSVATFLKDYWEIQPLHVARAEDSLFQDLISVTEILHVIAQRRLSFHHLQVIRADFPIDPTNYTTKSERVLPLRVLQFHHDGATVMLAQAQQHIDALHSLCSRVRQQLGIDCQTNVYLSPANAQGFKPHYDSHDVLILQTSGAKTFRFYAGGPELPEQRHRFDAQNDTIGEQTSEVQLSAGDTLYIPRGWLHDAISVGDEPSLHITMGLFAPTLADVATEMIDQARNQNSAWRQSLLRLTSQSAHLPLDSIVTNALGQLSEQQARDATQQLATDLAVESSPDLSGYMERLETNQQLQLTTSVSWRAAELLGLDERPSTLVLRTQGQILEMGKDHLVALQHLMTHERCQIESLPGLAPEQQLALCQTLVRENLLDID